MVIKIKIMCAEEIIRNHKTFFLNEKNYIFSANICHDPAADQQ